MQYIDLHVHTNCSDGTLTPIEVIKKAMVLNLAAIAITDHDTVSGITPARHYLDSLKEKHNFELISGVEISAEYHGKDIHILGLYINEKKEELVQTLDKALMERDHRNEKMAALLRADGIDIHVSDLTFGEPDTVITRAHFARFLTEHHYVKSNSEAFERYLGYHTPYYVPRTYIQPEDAIQLIRTAGGIPVLAHPLLYQLNLDELDRLISSLKDYGLAGIETIYSANTGFDEGIIRRFVNRYNLMMTGGSDFHGSNKPQIELGVGRGNLKIPQSLLVPLKKSIHSQI